MKKCIGLISANYTSGAMLSLVADRALAAVPFGGRYRLIDFPLSNMTNSGIKSIGLITPIKNRSLIEHVGTGKAWGIGRKASSLFLLPGSVSGERLAGSKFLIRDIIRNKQFIMSDSAKYVLLCGSNRIYNFDFNELLSFMDKTDSNVAMVYKKIESDGERNNLALEINENGFIEGRAAGKEGLINCFMDCIIMKHSYMVDFMEWYEALEDMDVADIIIANAARVKACAYEFKGYAAAVNSIKDYMNASMDLLEADVQEELFHNPQRPILTNVQDRAPTKYGKKAKIKNSIVSAGSRIEGTVENSIIFRSTVIGPGSVVKNCVLMQHCEIGENAIVENLIGDKFVKIGDGVHIYGNEDRPMLIDKGRSL